MSRYVGAPLCGYKQAVSSALVVLVLVLSFGLLAGTALVYVGLWRGFADQWKRFSARNRRRGLVAGAVTFVAAVGAMAVSIAEPWGPDSVLYVIGIGGGGIVVMLIATSVQAVRDTRRARERRSQ